jgi:hypothetical protein
MEASTERDFHPVPDDGRIMKMMTNREGLQFNVGFKPRKVLTGYCT